jgi:hypothetical protein
MKFTLKKATLLLVLFLSLTVQDGVSALSESAQQARLYRFRPAVVKRINVNLPEKEFLTAVAKDTWGYFRDVVDKVHGLPLDNVVVSPSETRVMSYTSTTNIGLYLMCIVSAQDLGFITNKDAETRIQKTLVTLGKLSRWDGQFFNYYDTVTLEATSTFVSSVDNGWLAIGLLVAGQAYPSLKSEIYSLLNQINFTKLYDPGVAQLYGGYDTSKSVYSPNHYGLFCTEPRATSFFGIARGQLPENHWYRMFRTLPSDWTWQAQVPTGETKVVGKHTVFYGTYQHGDTTFVPSWGGSMFEFLMPTLVLDEQGLSPKGLGANNRVAVREHIRYALEEKKYPVWGISPCSIPHVTLGYKEYGVPYLGSKGYADEGVITPHASFLALAVDPEAAVANIQKLAQMKGLYGEYGFYDSINVVTGVTSPRFMALDQGMTLIALTNYLEFGSIRERFMTHPQMQEQVGLLSGESFFQEELPVPQEELSNQ